MSIKTNLIKVVPKPGAVSLQHIMYDTVYRNAGDPNIYVIQCEFSGIFHIIRLGSFCSFHLCGEAVEYLEEDNIPDLWNDTDLTMVVSITLNPK